MALVQHHLNVLGLPLPAPLAVIELSGREELGGIYRYELLCEAPLGSEVSDIRHRRAKLFIGPRRVWGQISAAHRSHSRPLAELQAGRVIQFLDASLWLFTELDVQTHRDGRLNTRFVAATPGRTSREASSCAWPSPTPARSTASMHR